MLLVLTRYVKRRREKLRSVSPIFIFRGKRLRMKTAKCELNLFQLHCIGLAAEVPAADNSAGGRRENVLFVLGDLDELSI